jgi:hypothetical protein
MRQRSPAAINGRQICAMGVIQEHIRAYLPMTGHNSSSQEISGLFSSFSSIFFLGKIDLVEHPDTLLTFFVSPIQNLISL